MEKLFKVMLIVISLIGINTSVVSVDSVSQGGNAIIAPLNHGVDH